MSDLTLRAFEAELRAVEDGHHARSIGRGCFTVVSDTHRGKSYIVTVSALVQGEPIAFDCTPEGDQAYSDDHLHRRAYDGLVSCKHMALVGRALVRRGQAHSRLDDDKLVATSAFPFAQVESRLPQDPFSGLPE